MTSHSNSWHFSDNLLARSVGRFGEWYYYLLADIYDLHNVYGIFFTSNKIRTAVFRNRLISFGACNKADPAKAEASSQNWAANVGAVAPQRSVSF